MPKQELYSFNNVTIVSTTIVYMSNYYKSIYQIIRTGHWMTDQVSLELREFDISEPQFNVLRVLNGRNGNPITVQEIQERMVQRTSNVTRIIDKLISKELVVRKECPSNRRKMDIIITEKGIEFLKLLDLKINAFHKPMTNNLSSEELTLLTSLIKKLKGEENE